VDFYGPASRLAIELDGGIHDSPQKGWADRIRHRQIQQAGVRVLRFRNERVIEDLKGVLREIAEHLTVPSDGKDQIEQWVRAKTLEAGCQIVRDASGEFGLIEATESRFANQQVYDLTIEEDHSFITDVGIVHN
jgi:intein/homing endonuclease